MEENQSREQYFFEEETMAWLGEIISRTPRVAGIFTPSLLRFDNVWVFDADERWVGSERYALTDVTRAVPDLRDFGMVLIDPPFALDWRHMRRILSAARGSPVLISATEFCVACAGWGELFRAHGLTQVSAHFPRYRSIGNGYCESTIKRDGRTNISFYSNIPFVPPRRPAILHRDGVWTTYDGYSFLPCSTTLDPPLAEGVEAQGPGVSPALAKAVEVEGHWETMQSFNIPRWQRRLSRFLRLGS